jgi:capsular exopolysaccharide synthesis family protein
MTTKPSKETNVEENAMVPRRPRPVARRLPEGPLLGGADQSGVIRDLWAVLARRWRLVATTVGVLLGATTLYCLLATRFYMGQATVLIEGRTLQIMNGESVEAQSPFNGAKYDYYQTQFYLLRSETLVQRVIDEVGLAHDPRFLRLLPAPDAGETIDPAALRRQYLKQLTVLPLRGTRLVAVQFALPDAALAADVANAHARLFVRSGLENLYGAMEQIRGFLQAKLVELQPHVQQAELKLRSFEQAHKLMPANLKDNVANERVLELSRRVTAAEAERIALEAQYDLVQRHDYQSLPAVLASPLIQKLREEFSRLEIEHALLAQKFRPAYPRLRQLSGQLAHARELLNAETAKVVQGVEASYLAAQANADHLKAQLDAERRELLSRKSVETKLLTLIREAETTRALYDVLLARVKQLSVTGGAEVSNITIAELAAPPPFPAWPPTKLLLCLSLITGLVLGAGLAFVREAWDNTIRDAQSLRAAAGLGTLAIIPDFDAPPPGPLPERLRWHAARARRRAVTEWARIAKLMSSNGKRVVVQPAPPLVLGNGHDFLSAEAYRTLSTALVLPRTSASPRVIVITSAAGAEGKTTTAVNTAAALASAEAGVLLIDGDLRLPRCHESLGLPLGPGLSEYLGSDGNAESIQPTRIANLSFLAAGRLGANPNQLLTSWRLGMLLWQARKSFDFVVIDSPPVLAVSDALLLANLADGVIVVAERGRTREHALRSTVQRLYDAGVVPLGVVLNRGEVEPEYYRYTPNGRPALAARAGI